MFSKRTVHKLCRTPPSFHTRRASRHGDSLTRWRSSKSSEKYQLKINFNKNDGGGTGARPLCAEWKIDFVDNKEAVQKFRDRKTY